MDSVSMSQVAVLREVLQLQLDGGDDLGVDELTELAFSE
jgi:hypothetical protein